MRGGMPEALQLRHFGAVVESFTFLHKSRTNRGTKNGRKYKFSDEPAVVCFEISSALARC
jgi:hypothetical protein